MKRYWNNKNDTPLKIYFGPTRLNNKLPGSGTCNSKFDYFELCETFTKDVFIRIWKMCYWSQNGWFIWNNQDKRIFLFLKLTRYFSDFHFLLVSILNTV